MVEAELQFHSLRQTRFEACDGVTESLANLQDVLAFFHIGRDEYGALAVVSTDVTPLALGPTYLRNIAHAHDTTTFGADDRIAYLLEIFVRAGALDGKAARTDIDDAGGDVCVFAIERLDDSGRVQFEIGETLHIHFDPQFARRISPAFRSANSRYALQYVFQRTRMVFEFAIRGFGRDQSVLNDVDEPGAELADTDLAKFGGQIGS